ncbi:MAG TPA: PEP-utilizing enzyme [Jatrophihabitantaceae bacterium]|jgi:pyruvate,water dikinase
MTQPSLVDWEYWHNVWPTRRTLLTRGNAADGFPRPLTPLTQDLVVIFENSGVHDFLEKCLKVRKPGGPRPPFWMAFWGYVAVDADQHADLGDAMPGNSRRATLQRYSNLKPDPDQTEPARRLRDVPRRAAVTMRMIRSGRRAPRRIEAQLATIRGLRRDPARLDERECRRWIDDLEAVHSAAWETLLIGAGIAGTAFTFTTRLLGWATRGRAGDLANRLHVGIGNNESAEMGHTVRRLAEHARSHAAVGAALGRPVDEVLATDASFAELFAAALERFGFHTAPELELAQPTWRQEPRQLLDLVAREYARPSEAAETAQTTRRQAEADLRAQVPAFARLPIRLALRGSRHMMGVRENSKAPAVLIFDELRRVLEGAGPLLVARGVIAEPGDALYLRYAELKAVLGGADGPGRAEIDERKLQLQRCNQVTLPDLFEAEPGWVGLPSAEAFRSRGMLPPETTSADDSVIRGVAASPGRVTATVRVLADPFDDFEPGDVLVTRTVDPGWAAALASAGGVVLDIGGPMSHGAMVARELGVPCVVGTKVATTRLTNGMTVTLDGSSGEVHIH